MKLDETHRAELRGLRDELLNPAIEHRRILEIIQVFAILRPGLVQQVVIDHYEYKQNRKRLLGRLPLETTAAA